MRKDTELELLRLPSPAQPCERKKKKREERGEEVGPRVALVFIERL